jgi:methylglyoxal synthase
MFYKREKNSLQLEQLEVKQRECRIKKMLSGPIEVILKLLLELLTQMVLFFKDPLASHCMSDINMLLRVCDVHNVPIATNEQQLSYY